MYVYLFVFKCNETFIETLAGLKTFWIVFIYSNVEIARNEGGRGTRGRRELGHAETYAEYMPMKCMYIVYQST